MGRKVNLGNGFGGKHTANVAPIGMGASMRAGARVSGLTIRRRRIRRMTKRGTKPVGIPWSAPNIIIIIIIHKVAKAAQRADLMQRTRPDLGQDEAHKVPIRDNPDSPQSISSRA